MILGRFSRYSLSLSLSLSLPLSLSLSLSFYDVNFFFSFFLFLNSSFPIVVTDIVPLCSVVVRFQIGSTIRGLDLIRYPFKYLHFQRVKSRGCFFVLFVHRPPWKKSSTPRPTCRSLFTLTTAVWGYPPL
jgi:hypothetical protein